MVANYRGCTWEVAAASWILVSESHSQELAGTYLGIQLLSSMKLALRLSKVSGEDGGGFREQPGASCPQVLRIPTMTSLEAMGSWQGLDMEIWDPCSWFLPDHNHHPFTPLCISYWGPGVLVWLGHLTLHRLYVIKRNGTCWWGCFIKEKWK